MVNWQLFRVWPAHFMIVITFHFARQVFIMKVATFINFFPFYSLLLNFFMNCCNKYCLSWSLSEHQKADRCFLLKRFRVLWVFVNFIWLKFINEIERFNNWIKFKNGLQAWERIERRGHGFESPKGKESEISIYLNDWNNLAADY